MAYIYSYEKVSSNMAGWGAFNGNIYETGNYREIIRKKAAAGWRYVGYIPARQRGTGHIDEIDLIFEKEQP